ncbi:MAG: nitroreductase [Clostridia bacterium]|nr:nitroreductase [Clostridia bacterium]
MKDKLYDYIFKRKSNRKYNMTPIENELLTEIKTFADSLQPLYKNIKVEYEIASKVNNLFPSKAPYYFNIYSEDKEGYFINIGFLFQQMVLFLSSKGLGSCWLGVTKPIIKEKLDTKLEFIISIAFGNAIDKPYREKSEFIRKPLSQISSGTDERIEAAHLAPSAINNQNWFFDCINGKINVYIKKLNAIQALIFNKTNMIDIGIAISHLYIATLHQGKVFTFSQKSSVKDLKGYSYIGTVD